MPYFTNTERGVLAKHNNINLESTGNNINNSSYNKLEGYVQENSTKISIVCGSGNDNEFNGCVLELITGRNRNCSRIISSFVNQTATLETPFNFKPNTNSYFIIHNWSGKLPKQNQDNPYSSVLLPETFQLFDNQFNNCFIKILEGSGNGQIRMVVDCSSNESILNLSSDWSQLPSEESLYVIYGESGICQDSDGTHITLYSLSSDYIKPNNYIEIYKGAGKGQIRKIKSFDVISNQLEVDEWDTVPDNTSYYNIFGGWCGQYENVMKHAIITVTCDINIQNGERMVISLESSIDELGNNKKNKLAEVSSDINSSEHALTITTKYFRLKIVSMGYKLDGSIQTIFNSYKSGKLTSLIESPINENSNCELSRSVITAKTNIGVYQNISADRRGSLFTSIKSPLDAFGNISNTTPIQIAYLNFPYGFINPILCKYYFIKGASVNASDSLLYLNSGTGNGKAILQSTKILKYHPGLAISILFTCLFSEPIDNSLQLIGYGNSSNGIFIGYNNLDLGILRRYGGKNEIRILEILSSANTDENITITLNGNQSSNIEILNGDTPGTIVFKIISNINTIKNLGNGWEINQHGNKIIFISITSKPLNDTYNLNSSNINSTFTRIQEGRVPNEEWFYQSNWNYDKALGNEELCYINFQLGNVYKLDIQWLGFGNITISIENPETGYFVPIHMIKFTNSSFSTSLENPDLPLYIHLEKFENSSSDALILKTACMTGFIRGHTNNFLGIRHGKVVHCDTSSISLFKNNYYNILSIKNNAIFKNTVNHTEIMLMALSISFTNSSNNKRGGIFTFFTNCVFDNSEEDIIWTERQPILSVVSLTEQNVIVTGGSELISIPIGKDGHEIKTIHDIESFIPPGNFLTLAFKPFSDLLISETEIADISASISWIERS